MQGVTALHLKWLDTKSAVPLVEVDLGINFGVYIGLFYAFYPQNGTEIVFTDVKVDGVDI